MTSRLLIPFPSPCCPLYKRLSSWPAETTFHSCQIIEKLASAYQCQWSIHARSDFHWFQTINELETKSDIGLIPFPSVLLIASTAIPEFKKKIPSVPDQQKSTLQHKWERTNLHSLEIRTEDISHCNFPPVPNHRWMYPYNNPLFHQCQKIT